MKVVLVTGGRNYRFQGRVTDVLSFELPDMVIHGGATGADDCAGMWARAYDRIEVRCPASWGVLGKAAGPIRNAAMVSLLKDLSANHDCKVIAFPGGAGTADMVSKVRKAGFTVLEIAS